MASKVLVKIPAVAFPQAQVKNVTPELVGVVARPEHAILPGGSDPLLRAAQLEQNIRFLQEQHQQMLSGLHQEIEVLRQRNRDLQFQLVFTKGGTAMVLSTPSSPEADTKQKISLGPRPVDKAPIQVELLEKELAETKTELENATTRNAYLTTIIEQYKQKLETKWDAPAEAEPDPDLQYKLQEAEKLVRCLRRENDEQRRELSTIRTSLASPQNGAVRAPAPETQSRGPRQNRGGPRNSYQGHPNHPNHPNQGNRGENQPRFPPLQTQNYWYQRGGGHARGGRMNHIDKDAGPNTSLPNLRGLGGQPAGGYQFPNGNAELYLTRTNTEELL